MLDLAKLAPQIPSLNQEMQKEAKISQERLKLANQLFSQAKQKQAILINAQKQWQERLIFTSATPMEALDTAVDINIAPLTHSVFSADGSQIAPSHHEIAYCYLINIGRIMLHYGQNLHPLLDSTPEIYYKSQDLYASRKWGIRTEEWMSYQRTVSEAEVLAEMACTWVNPPGAHYDIPNLAMMDGSLIYWFLETLAIEVRNQILTPIIDAWQRLQESRIPLVGYISASRSMEAISFLRFSACPYENPNCVVFCGDVEDKAPCQKFEPLRDATFWTTILQPQQRSAIFRSNSRILGLYPEYQQIYFCYLHVGSEIARVEFPQWVAESPEILNQALSITLTQVAKGYGYPVSLAEAHNLAVVKGSDRSRFFALLEEQMIRSGLRNVGTSHKENRKRGSIA